VVLGSEESLAVGEDLLTELERLIAAPALTIGHREAVAGG
jgi:hypothetical protein